MVSPGKRLVTQEWYIKFKAAFTRRFPEQEWQTQSEFDLPYDTNITDKGERWQGSGG